MGDDLEMTVDKFTFRIPAACQYTEAGVWVWYRPETGMARIGLSDYRQQSSGDVAFVELPEVGRTVVAGEDLAEIETVKVDLEVPAPFEATVTAVNDALADTPELINEAPYDAGWLAELRPAAWPVPGLLSAEAYLAVMKAQAESGAEQ